ncbi:hypothetical protein DFQ27_004973 [Actinomortierella ambigua]|uniref:Peptidase A1 domain-containing protein n=1 Tax=Actinomortierella ambigua TaxID=1343610 RepID=A0A9P6UC76_9FUNG|nr:hypothetical protein DFQ27_004973 [Actinomortierella ambigua]
MPFTVIVDTGTSDLFIPGPDCPTCAGHKTYDPKNSKTAVKLNRQFEIEFDENSKVQGVAYLETVTIGEFKAENQTIGVATQYSTNMGPDQFPADGLLGLAFESVSALAVSPLVQTLVAQGQLDEPVFSLKLASHGSELFLGGKNGELFTGEITYTPVTQEGFWTVALDSINVNQESVVSDRKAIIDSGTTLTIISPSEAEKLFSMIPGARSSSVGNGFYTYPCDSSPAVSLTFRGRSFNIALDKFNLGAESEGSSDCIAGIAGQDLGVDHIIVGATFLTNVYTVFDVDKKQVGFASLA